MVALQLRLRCALVWAAVTAAATVAARLLLPGVEPLWSVPVAARARGEAVAFDQLLVAACTLALLACLAWAWLVTTVVVTEALGRTVPTGADRRVAAAVPTWARRLVLAACGTALVVNVSPAGAAHADPGTGAGWSSTAGVPGAVAADLDVGGLPYPDRPTGPDRSGAPRPPVGSPPVAPGGGAVYAVHPGDSLWRIAERSLTSPDGTTTPTAAEVAAQVARTYDDNRHVVGDDPDLILPGQQLRLPPP